MKILNDDQFLEFIELASKEYSCLPFEMDLIHKELQKRKSIKGIQECNNYTVTIKTADSNSIKPNQNLCENKLPIFSHAFRVEIYWKGMHLSSSSSKWLVLIDSNKKVIHTHLEEITQS